MQRFTEVELEHNQTQENFFDAEAQDEMKLISDEVLKKFLTETGIKDFLEMKYRDRFMLRDYICNHPGYALLVFTAIQDALTLLKKHAHTDSETLINNIRNFLSTVSSEEYGWFAQALAVDVLNEMSDSDSENEGMVLLKDSRVSSLGDQICVDDGESINHLEHIEITGGYRTNTDIHFLGRGSYLDLRLPTAKAFIDSDVIRTAFQERYNVDFETITTAVFVRLIGSFCESFVDKEKNLVSFGSENYRYFYFGLQVDDHLLRMISERQAFSNQLTDFVNECRLSIEEVQIVCTEAGADISITDQFKHMIDQKVLHFIMAISDLLHVEYDLGADFSLEYKLRLQDLSVALRDNLERFNGAVEIFKSSFRFLKTHELINLEHMRGVTFEAVSATDLQKEDQEALISILRQNYGDESKEFVDSLTNTIRSKFTDARSNFYLMRHNGRIIGFNRFDDNLDHHNPHVYFGSFNVDKTFGQSKIGEVIYNESLSREVEKGKRIEADCDPTAPIARKYISSGFAVTQFYEYAGKPSFHIVYDTMILDNTEGHTLSLEEIKKRAETATVEETIQIVREVDDNDSFSELMNGYMLTAYVTDHISSRTYAVFEKLTLQ